MVDGTSRLFFGLILHISQKNWSACLLKTLQIKSGWASSRERYRMSLILTIPVLKNSLIATGLIPRSSAADELSPNETKVE